MSNQVKITIPEPTNEKDYAFLPSVEGDGIIFTLKAHYPYYAVLSNFVMSDIDDDDTGDGNLNFDILYVEGISEEAKADYESRVKECLLEMLMKAVEAFTQPQE
jgi:hypothetical protein